MTPEKDQGNPRRDAGGRPVRIRSVGMGGAGLTASEERVAALVARGQTNREVAASLGLSAKTVEWHLSHLYRKLGVRSRTELALAWNGGDPNGDRLVGTAQERTLHVKERNAWRTE